MICAWAVILFLFAQLCNTIIYRVILLFFQLLKLPWFNKTIFPTVVYDGCPRSFTHAVWWPRTKFGIEAVSDCPAGKKLMTTKLQKRKQYEQILAKYKNLF